MGFWRSAAQECCAYRATVQIKDTSKHLALLLISPALFLNYAIVTSVYFGFVCVHPLGHYVGICAVGSDGSEVTSEERIKQSPLQHLDLIL